MTNPQPRDTVSRRTTLAGVGASGVGFALAATARQASAQDATPTAAAVHPIVGTWMVDLIPDAPADSPTVIVVLADGAVIDPVRGSAGRWEATGPRSVAWTAVGY